MSGNSENNKNESHRTVLFHSFPVSGPGGRIVVSGSEFQNSTRLANGGEQIVLSAFDGSPIKDFTYNDRFPWPESADGDGFSLVLIDAESNPDHNDPRNWRRSAGIGGSPGTSDTSEFVGDPNADDDSDGMPALLEHLFGSSDTTPGGSPIQVELATDGDLLITFPRDAGAEEISVVFESSSDLTNWSPEAAVLETVTATPTPMERWRLGASVTDRKFLRLRAVK